MSSPLDHERKLASFDVQQMTYLLYGGQKRTERLLGVRRIVEDDPEFDNCT